MENEGKMNRPGQEEAPLDSIEELVRPGDWALVIFLQSPFLSSSFEKMGFEDRLVIGGHELDDKDHEGFMPGASLEQRRRAWEHGIEAIDNAVAKLVHRSSQGRIHVFFSGPHPAGVYLGRKLNDHFRLREIFIHQNLRNSPRWIPFVIPSYPPDGRDPVPYFGEPSFPDRVNGVVGTDDFGVSLEGGREATHDLLVEAAMRYRLARVYRLVPEGDRTIASPAQASGALQQMIAFLDRLRLEHPDGVLHIMTSLPVSLMVALGQALSPTVWRGVVVHCLDTRGKKDDPASSTSQAGEPVYYPVLEVMSGKLQLPTRTRFRIFSGDGGFLMYRVNGRVLPVARQVPAFLPFDRVVDDPERIVSQADEFAQLVLPDVVDQEVGDWTDVDVVVELSGSGANLPWEFLYSRRMKDFIASRERCSIMRLLPTDSAYPGRGRAGQLRVLIAPVLSQDRDGRNSRILTLGRMKDELEGLGVKVSLLDWGVSDKEVAAEIAEFKPDIFQWIGHGKEAQGDALVSIAETESPGEDIPLDRILMRRIFQGLEHRPRIVLLTSCKLGSGTVRHGVPRDLIMDGVEAVISYRDAVRFEEAAVFARTFFKTVAGGHPLAMAVSAARRELHRSAKLESGVRLGAFAAPVLTCSNLTVLGPVWTPREARTSTGYDPERGPAGTGTIGMTSDVRDPELELH